MGSVKNSNSFHILSLNVQGLRDKQKRARLIQWAKYQSADILLLQETHFTNILENELNIEFSEWDLYHSFGETNSRGCSIFIKNTLFYNLIDTVQDPNGRFILLNIELFDSVLTLVNLYSPNHKQARNIFYHNLNEIILNSSQGIKIIGGDHNDTLTHNDRIYRCVQDKPKKVPVTNLSKMIKSQSLIDIWKHNNSNKTQYTWRRKNGIEKSRLDFWLIEENFIPQVLSTDIRPALIQHTDHMAISLKLKIPNTRGKGFWKFNNTLLDDPTYIEKINSLITTIKSLNINSHQTKWEICKLEIKDETINFSKLKAKQRNIKLQNLEKELKSLLDLKDEFHDEHTKAKIRELQSEIEFIYNFKATGAQIRARVQFLEEGERNTKYFHSLEKSRQARKVITSLKIDNNTITDTYEILNEEVRFYEKLYNSDSTINPSEFDQYLNNTVTNYLNNDQANICEGKLSNSECYESLKDMKLNKSPGLDGLTVEFYQKFWPLIGDLVTNSLNEGYDRRNLSATQSESVFSLIYKKGDPDNLENWRPISLLTIDYKIAARVLAKRLQKVIHNIVSLDQQGYIKNRYIGYNIRQIQDIIDYTDILKLDGIILFLDFKKAFDTVEWNFMLNVLHKFGFKESFIHWVKTFYSNITSCVINNGWRSNSFQVNRGIRQGCPLSALLFIIVAEILAIKIRNNDQIKGIEVKTSSNEIKTLKITQLADDTTLFVKSEQDIKNALHTIDTFGNFSGLKLNKQKTTGLWIGNLKFRAPTTLHNISITNDHVKALGIYFGTNKAECHKLNWDSKLESCQTLINAWNKRNLTMNGRILVIKSILIPKFTYLLQNLEPTKQILNDINTMFYKFLWKGKNDKIKRATVIGPKLQGGLDMIDIHVYYKSLTLKWINHLKTVNNANWKVIPYFFLNQYGNNLLIFNMKLDSIKSLSTVKTKLSCFYTSLINNWIDFNITCKSNTEKQTTFFEIRKEIIWGNKNIKYNGKCILFKTWIDSNIIFINDIISANGEIDTKTIYNKLNNKHNWISELNILKKAIPKHWKNTIKTNDSIKTKVKTTVDIVINFRSINLFNSKDFYQMLLKSKFEKPYIHSYWQTLFNCTINWESFYYILNKINIDNRIKQFKYKAIHRILATNENLYKWKILNTSDCKFCNNNENYEHFFIECAYLDIFWGKIDTTFKKCGFQKTFRTLKSMIIGYKIEFIEYNFTNMLLNIIAYCIYKTYYMSDRRTKNIDMLNILYNDIFVAVQYFENKQINPEILKQFLKLM